MTLSSKGFPDSNNKSPIRKKVICIGDKTPALLLMLHESIVTDLATHEECWLEQILMGDGIFLRVSREL